MGKLSLKAKSTFYRSFATLHFLLKAPEPGNAQAAGQDVEDQRGPEHAVVAAIVKQPGAHRQRDQVGQVPAVAKHGQPEHPLPDIRRRVIWEILKSHNESDPGYLGVELSAMKLYVIMMKVSIPPEMFWTGM